MPSIRPHLSLTVTDDADGLRKQAPVLALHGVETEIEMAAVSLFPADPPVLVLAVAPAPELVALHERVSAALAAAGVDIWPHYRPGSWLPHCTLSMGVPANALDERWPPAWRPRCRCAPSSRGRCDRLRHRSDGAAVTRLTAYVSALVALDLALFSAIVPLLPQLSDQLDLTKVQSGLLLGAYSGAVLVTAVPIGHLADRLGMRNVNVAGSLLVCAATATFAVGSSFELLFAARVAQGVGSAVAWSAGLAWLAARTPEHRRGTGISIANASATGGMIAGPVLGGVVAGAIGTRTTFLALAACSLLLAVWGAFEPDARAPAERESSFLPALRAAAAERLIAVSFILILLVAVIGGTLQVLMPLHLGAEGVSQSALGFLYAGGAALGAVTITTTGRLGDRIGRLPLARAACLATGGAVAVLLLPLGTDLFAFMLVAIIPIQSVLYGVGYPLGADGADRAGLGHGLVLGLINVIWGAGAVVGPVLGAAVATHAGDGTAYALLVVLSFCAAAAVGQVARSMRAETTTP